jgi:signal transduction histidine kinase
MKLNQKLILGFLLVSLLAIGLAGLIIQISTANGFSQFLINQKEQLFVDASTAHYQTKGTWQGVENSLQTQGVLPPAAKPGSPPPDPQPYTLVDTNRIVIVAGAQYQIGQKVQKGTLAKGIAIVVDDLQVGTVLYSGKAPVRTVLEEKYLTTVNNSLLAACLAAMVISALLGLAFTQSITRPLGKLTAATHRMAAGDLSQQVNIAQGDELGQLASSFNQMSASLAKATLAQRQMTADIAHDLRNPLTVLGGYIESLQDGTLQATPERLKVMQAEVTQLRRLVEDLRTLSLADAGELKLQPEPVSPAELLQQVSASFAGLAEARGVKLTAQADAAMSARSMDPFRMQQVLGNLVSNALDHTPAGGSITLAARQKDDHLILTVEDTGKGIATEIMPRIFERSFSGDPNRSGSGSGLGLPIARSIIQLHGGTISARSSLGRGSTFTITL